MKGKFGRIWSNVSQSAGFGLGAGFHMIRAELGTRIARHKTQNLSRAFLMSGTKRGNFAVATS